MITIIIFLIAQLKKLGALADNEMFGLEPAYIFGGEIKKFSLFKKIEFSDGKIIIDNESVSWSLKNLVHKQNTHAISKFIEKRKRNFI